MSINEGYISKGDAFKNRYRLEGELIATSPTHIGTGETRPDENRPTLNEGMKKEEPPPEISEIVRDFSGKPYLPGSALRGVVRHYLLQVFLSSGNKIAADPDFERLLEKYDTQVKQIRYMKTKASLLERLFGTPFSESKIEFWDAPAINKVEADDLEARGWNNDRQSYVVRSVAIDPMTGAAEKHKLFSFDVAPPGLSYHVNIVGQNLSDIELGFLLFGLEGFNSKIYPLTIGAMSGRGFGRMEYKPTNIYCLKRDGLEGWIKKSLSSDSAGYEMLEVEEKSNELIKHFKEEFIQAINRKGQV